ncbi:MAG: dCTP deaminase [Pseudomonadota bacterium]
MIFSDGGLQKLIDAGELVFDPITPESIQPASIDCRLGDHYLVVEPHETPTITMSQEIKYKEVVTDKITIPPHSFLLATTMEYIKLPDDMVAFVEGRSSIGRMGLFIQNAGWVDPGFEGKITLELYNANSLPIELESGRRICQLVFGKMDAAALRPYRGKYQGQNKAVGSEVWKDSENSPAQ